jgi:micrococcal nuclease
MKKLFVLIFLLIPALAIPCEFEGQVVGVTDGDTLKVLMDGKAQKVRLFGIDTPEKGQPFSKRAKQLTSNLAFKKIVRVKIKDIGRWGRIIGIVTLPDGKVLNRELLQAGMAWVYRKYTEDPELIEIETNAKAKQIGLWGEKNPVPPWDFRKSKKKSG